MLVIGHRGAKGLAPENTKAGFEAALKYGVDAIEFDVWTTQDGKVILNHDAKINSLDIATADFAELKSIKPDLLTLKESLEIIDNQCPVIIEIKKGSDIQTVIADLKELKLPKDSRVASFNMPILQAIKAVFPDMPLTVNEKWSGVRGSYRCRKLGTKYLTMQQRWLWSGFVWSVAKGGYKLGAYPINNPIKAQRWAKRGLYAAITDRPDRFR